ncbi:chalcone isomerase family protein [Ectopseudomonas mendocina]|uniref:Chalcone isomerase family protein n=1 Tax=Ectopseudomonas mendocina TaxID=300 RepID=A0ABZ2RJV9_ECTME
MPRISCLLQMLLATLLICTQAQASWREAIPDSRLIGSGELRMFGFSIYKAELWSDAGSADSLLSFQEPFALQLTYSRSISADDLVATSIKEIRRIQGSVVDPAQLDRWALEMQQAFVDVAEGERITGVFLPGRGARFYAGDAFRHGVSDQAFARAFFSIWLDAQTRTPELRARLIGAIEP